MTKHPRQTADSLTINVRYPMALVRALDDWRREQPDLPERPEAIRRILAAQLKVTK